MGILYESGKGPTKDSEIAMQYYREAAEMGNIDAMNNVGFCYQNGNGVQQSYEEAARWFVRFKSTSY